MTPNNNLNVLAFYDSIAKQNHRKSYSYGDIFPLISQSRIILPFQLIRSHLENSPVTEFILINFETEQEYDITAEMLVNNVEVREFDQEGYDIILNYGKWLLTEQFSFKGNFYVRISDGTNTWYSDIFNFIQDVSKYLKLIYYNRNEIFEYTGGAIDYNDGYQNFCYLNTEVGKPKYEFEETVQERDGYTFPEKQVSEKVYVFEFVTPEYLMDALRIVRLHDYIYIVSKGETYKVDNFLIDIEWEEQGNLGVAEAEYQTDTVMKRIGKGFDNLIAGDFNNDFSNDFYGGGGETGGNYGQTLEAWTGSDVLGVGNTVIGCRFKINILGEGAFLYDQVVANDYKLDVQLVYGTTYEFTIEREGYITQTKEILNGLAGGITTMVLVENPATIEYSVDVGGSYLGGTVLNVDIVVEDATGEIFNGNTGATGLLNITFKKGINYALTLSKLSYIDTNYFLYDYANPTLLVEMDR